jgi:hypothetical protein
LRIAFANVSCPARCRDGLGFIVPGMAAARVWRAAGQSMCCE